MTVSTLHEPRVAAAEARRRTARRHPALWLLIGLGVAIVAIIATIVWLVPPPPLREVATWFDPMFFQYNVLLLVVFVSMVPAITLVYVDMMKRERVVRLQADLSETEWAEHAAHINQSINIQFGPLNYVGSTVILTVIIALFLAVMLLLKPVAGGEPGQGVNYARGANLLLLGPYIESIGATDESARAQTYHRVIVSLTAFQFGFLGAYVFFIGHLLRSYFTLDLSPNTFISISGRMVISSVTALVLSFPLQEMVGRGRAAEYSIAFLPLLSFFIGFFPSTGLLIIEKAASRMFRVATPHYAATSLAKLSGMSLEHETRLRREGFDNIENLADADPIGLAVRTGFGYRQLRDWIGEAWLRTHLRGDYDAFVKGTGIATREELRRVLAADARNGSAAPFASAIPAALDTKVRLVGALLGETKIRER